jgi:hypothetical protein
MIKKVATLFLSFILLSISFFLVSADSINPSEEWDSTTKWSRPILYNHSLYMVKQSGTQLYKVNFTTGSVEATSPILNSNTNTNVAPTMDTDENNIVYYAEWAGEIGRYNVSSDSHEWIIDLIPGDDTNMHLLDGNHMPYVTIDGTGYLFCCLYNGTIYKIDTDNNGNVVDTYDFDDTAWDTWRAGMREDYDEQVLYVQGNQYFRRIWMSNLTVDWSIDMTSNGAITKLTSDPGNPWSADAYKCSRATPLLVNDYWTGNEDWIITFSRGDEKMFCYDKFGNQEWVTSAFTDFRAMPSYHPDFGYIYINSYDENKIYVYNITDGSHEFTITPPHEGNRPMFVTGDYLIHKSTYFSGTNYLMIFYCENGTHIDTHTLYSVKYRCDPMLTSQGYTALTHTDHPVCINWGVGGNYSDYSPYAMNGGTQFVRDALPAVHNPAPPEDESSEIGFQSINNQENNTVTSDVITDFNWTKVDNASYYTLSASNNSDMSSPIYNITIYTSDSNCWDNATGYIEYVLPEAYQTIWNKYYYYQVSAYHA